MLRLENPVQPYAWGSLTAIPELLGRAATGAPQAELWLGAHPSAPSQVVGDAGLDAVIARAPNALLGDAVVARFGPSLPFLLKVLAAAQPLSLQAHPSLAQAREGFAREEAAGIPRAAAHRNYKDANHKPELICALGTFHALCGFRKLADSVALFTGLGEPLGERLSKEGLRAAFQHVMTLPAADQRALALSVTQACAQRPPRGFERECAWAVRLGNQYPGDVGVVGALLLNLVTLEEGDALFLPAGNLHAYLEGVGVELMANSDNVLRGGLTPKHVDVAELLRVLDFGDGPARVLRPTGAPEAIYETPAPEFRLSRIDVAGPVGLPRSGPDILLVTKGEVELSCGGEVLDLAQGESVFVGADEGALTLDGQGRVFRAAVGTT
ncbi:MAG: mannose-6-phosphate isomerase, class I [Myxococcota bacterium]